MGRNIVTAKLDIIFKTMFSKSENEDILHSFLSTMLELPYDSIKEIVIQNSEILPETITGKFSRLDLKIEPMSIKWTRKIRKNWIQLE